MQLTSKERIMRIFQNKEIDRPALKLWGAGLEDSYALLHPAYEPVRRLAAQTSDLFLTCGTCANIYLGQLASQYMQTYAQPTADPLWQDQHTFYHTPMGDLHGVLRISTVGEPSYITEYPIKEPQDMEKFLSMKFIPCPIDRSEYDLLSGRIGDRGVVMASTGHAGYYVQSLMGSETLAYFSVDNREELTAFIAAIAERVMTHVRGIFDAGIHAPISYVGPELFLPPLMGPRDFDDFVYRFDKPLCDHIHERGSYVWVHSHGRVNHYLEKFISMGVDILNPLEPPKNGDIHLGEAVAKYGNRIGWEGNIEIQELLLSSPDRIRALIDECVALGSPSGRFILCPSAGFNEYPFPTQEYVDNLLLYLQYGLEAVERCRK